MHAHTTDAFIQCKKEYLSKHARRLICIRTEAATDYENPIFKSRLNDIDCYSGDEFRFLVSCVGGRPEHRCLGMTEHAADADDAPTSGHNHCSQPGHVAEYGFLRDFMRGTHDDL
ncbi:unnamed protein product [Sphagnum balticum]